MNESREVSHLQFFDPEELANDGLGPLAKTGGGLLPCRLPMDEPATDAADQSQNLVADKT